MKKNNPATMVAKDNGTKEQGKPEWPVQSADQLTVGHVSLKVRDEILRPYLAAARTLGDQFLAQVDSTNDLRGKLVQLARDAQKEGVRLNQQAQLQNVAEALIKLGIANPPTEGGGKA